MAGKPYLQHLAWLDVAGVVDRVGSEGFERTLYTWVIGVVPVSVFFAIEIFDDDRPGRVLLTEGHTTELTRRAMRISADYAEEDHVTDEVFRNRRPHRLGQTEIVIQSGAEHSPEFRLKYFDSMGSPQEIAAFSRNTESTLYVGYSSMSYGFSADEIDRIKAILPLVQVLVRRHATVADRTGLGLGPAKRERILQSMLHEREPQLTPREIEVCAAIVVGFRAEAVGLRLGISPNTVATHRKHAYSKLNISSLTELFGLLFAGWSESGDSVDP